MLVDLTKASGLPISLDVETGKLVATGEVDLGEQGERCLSQLREVLAYPYATGGGRSFREQKQHCLSNRRTFRVLSLNAATDDRVCYYTYRGVGTRSDLELLAQHSLRYDITVTLPGLIGCEYMKTAGHVHSEAPDGVPYPEIYEVLHGSAVFLIQDGFDEADVWAQCCMPGHRIVIPFGSGHVTINVGDEPLVVSDLIASACSNDYEPLRTRRGAAYRLKWSVGSFYFERNFNYSKQTRYPEIALGSRWPKILPLDNPLIEQFRQDPENFQFLVTPRALFATIWSCWR